MKVNIHITEACNYHCKHCFAHFPQNGTLVADSWKIVLDNLAESRMVDAINFAGGEPLLYYAFSEVVKYAKKKGFSLSLITNGSLIKSGVFFPKDLFPLFDMIGFSIDSLNEKTLFNIGRRDANNKVMSREEIIDLLNYTKEQNPKAKIKVNTVVSKLNKDEQIVGLEDSAHIDRWKFLKIEPFDYRGFSNKELLISDKEFDGFLSRNQRKYGEMVIERTMEHSYLIIDNFGNLLDDKNYRYTVLGNLMYEPFEEVIKKYSLDKEKYDNRYKKAP